VADGGVDRATEIGRLATEAYLGWFTGLYRRDRDQLAQWVATEELLAAGEAAITAGLPAFTAPPDADHLRLVVDDVLLDRPDCVAVRATDDIGGFIATPDGSQTTIMVFRPGERGRLRMVSLWDEATPRAVWSADCGVQGGNG
jgi:hypothetical protein